MARLNKKKLVIYIIMVAVMAVANIYYFTKNISGPSDGGNQLMNDLEVEIANRYTTGRRSSILENKLFQELEKIGDWPVSPPAKIGRANPFVPFFEN